MRLTISLAGEIHSRWRGELKKKVLELNLPVAARVTCTIHLSLCPQLLQLRLSKCVTLIKEAI